MKVRRLLYLASIFGLFAGLFGTSFTANAATFPGENGNIAFTTMGQAGKEAIWTLKLQSGHTKLLRNDAHSPVWSPDGEKIAFVGADGHIWVMDAKGHKRKKLTDALGYRDDSPVWSSDGSRLAFVRKEKTGIMKSAIFITKKDGSVINLSGWGYFRSPSWSPSGRELVYEQYGGVEHTLHIKNVNTSEMRTLTTLSDAVESHVSWSPGGKKILYSDSSNEIYTIWPDGSHRAVISDGDSYSASWSPNGKRIAFLEDPADDHISISEEDGTVRWVPVQKDEYHTIGAPLWSPDGSKLFFTMSHEASGQKFTGTFLVDAKEELQTPVKIADGELKDPNWQAK